MHMQGFCRSFAEGFGRIAAMILAALLALGITASLAWANNGDATDAWGAQTQLAPTDPSGTVEIDVVQLAGDEGDTAFFTVEAGGVVQANRLAHQFETSTGGGFYLNDGLPAGCRP